MEGDEKVMVYVVKVVVSKQLDGNVHKSLHAWKERTAGAYAAEIELHEVVIPEN